MKKQIIKSIVAVSFLVLVSIVSSNAQTHSQIAVNVPFDFYVKNQKFTAGKYLIESLNPRSNQTNLVIRQKDGEAKMVVMMLPLTVNGERSEAKPILIFNSYGSTYFLSEIRNPVENFGAQLLKTKEEKNLARQFGNPTREAVALR